MRPASVGFHCPDDTAAAAKAMRPQRTVVGGRLRGGVPYVTGTLVGLNVLVYVFAGLRSSGGLGDPTRSWLFADWQLLPWSVYHQDQYYRLITSAFLHLSPIHIGANMVALAIVGPPLERLLGRWRFGALYLIGGLGGSAAIYAFGNPLQPVAGASGAIFALFAACLVMVRRLGLDAQWLVGIIAINFVFTFSVSGISKLGHIGGFATGVLVALVIAGWPSFSPLRDRTVRRIPDRLQVVGLSGLVVLLVGIIALRTATGASSFVLTG
ncbi:MAG: rhomboid family intramembrane serine protease [Jatrophihabitantaceae bacterium]